MISKWYWSILVIALAFVGISLEQKNAPNQEIVVQFNDSAVSPDDTQAAIETVKKQLQSIGITDVRIDDAQKGALKISYYSAVDVSFIEVLFSNQENLSLEENTQKEDFPISFPLQPDSTTFQLNISEIPSNAPQSLGLNGVVAEVKFLRDQSVKPIVFFRPFENDFHLKKPLQKFTNNLHSISVFITDNNSYKIPEVRAGPLS